MRSANDNDVDYLDDDNDHRSDNHSSHNHRCDDDGRSNDNDGNDTNDDVDCGFDDGPTRHVDRDDNDGRSANHCSEHYSGAEYDRCRHDAIEHVESWAADNHHPRSGYHGDASGRADGGGAPTDHLGRTSDNDERCRFRHDDDRRRGPGRADRSQPFDGLV